MDFSRVPKELVSVRVKNAALMADVSTKTIRRAIASGALKATKPSAGIVLIPLLELEAWMHGRNAK